VLNHYQEHSRGFERFSLVSRACGSVHCAACISRLVSGGNVMEHVYAED
jgi:hypothetical protein